MQIVVSSKKLHDCLRNINFNEQQIGSCAYDNNILTFKTYNGDIYGCECKALTAYENNTKNIRSQLTVNWVDVKNLLSLVENQHIILVINEDKCNVVFQF